MSINATLASDTVAAAVTAGNPAIPRDQKTEVSSSSGSRRRRLPDIPPLQTVAGNRIGSVTGSRRRTTIEQNGNSCGDVTIDLNSSSLMNGDDVTSDVGERCCDNVKQIQNGGCNGRPLRTLGSTTNQEFSVEHVPNLLHAEEVSWVESGSTGRSELVASYRRPSLFALMRTCRLISLTLKIPKGIPSDDAVVCDVISGVIRLMERAVPNAGGQRRLSGLRCGDVAARSAFRPVGQASTTRNPAENSTHSVDDDDKLVIVSAVHRGVTGLSDSGQLLLPGDILLEVQYNCCYIIGGQIFISYSVSFSILLHYCALSVVFCESFLQSSRSNTFLLCVC